MTGYAGRAWREDDWWVVDVTGIGTTQARTLDKVDHMARSLVADLSGAPYESVEVTVTIELPPEIAAQVAEVRTKTEQAAALTQEACALQVQLVQDLSSREGLTGREIATILKVTPGRISQIIRKKLPAQAIRTTSPRRPGLLGGED